MTDDRFDDLMRDAAHTYRRPPAAPLDDMWKNIETAVYGERVGGHTGGRAGGRKWRLLTNRWLALAATLVIGVGLGRASMVLGRAPAVQPPIPQNPVVVAAVASARPDSLIDTPYASETSQYLGQTAALLIALPSEVRAGGADQEFIHRADDLLTTTRLLLDSPAASDPQMRGLLDDLELVLAQIVRLENNKQSRTELDLIRRALEQRDVIPRLRTAVADISAN